MKLFTKQQYRKFSAVLLILIFLFNISGDQLLFSVWQAIIQKNIQHKIDSGLINEQHDIIVLSFNNESDIQWLIPGKELKYEGMLYDVVTVKKESNKIFCYCLADEKEKDLIFKHHETNKKKNEEKRTKLNRNIQLFFQQFAFDFKIFIGQRCFKEFISRLLFCYLSIPSPPPKKYFLFYSY